MKKILTIAGSDSSGGAGIQADIKTITAHKMYAMSVITALTAQNTVAVTAIADTEPQFVAQQMDAVFSDIYPDAIKIGMVSSVGIITVIAKKLREYAPQHIVLDPVMISASGYKLLSDEAQTALMSELIPLCEILTPNVPEAEILCNFKVENETDMEGAAVEISAKAGCAVLVKGGHLFKDTSGNTTLTGEGLSSSRYGDSDDMYVTDILCENGKVKYFTSKRIKNPNNHGTGCTLSSAIACNLAVGMSLEASISEAKSYLNDALASMLDLGAGAGPLDHSCRIPPFKTRGNPIDSGT